MHIVPCDISIADIEDPIVWEEICSIEEIYKFVMPEEKPYLFFSYKNKKFIRESSGEASQFFRRRLCQHM
jgi:hypothetical protein